MTDNISMTDNSTLTTSYFSIKITYKKPHTSHRLIHLTQKNNMQLNPNKKNAQFRKRWFTRFKEQQSNMHFWILSQENTPKSFIHKRCFTSAGKKFQRKSRWNCNTLCHTSKENISMRNTSDIMIKGSNNLLKFSQFQDSVLHGSFQIRRNLKLKLRDENTTKMGPINFNKRLFGGRSIFHGNRNIHIRKSQLFIKGNILHSSKLSITK